MFILACLSIAFVSLFWRLLGRVELARSPDLADQFITYLHQPSNRYEVKPAFDPATAEEIFLTIPSPSSARSVSNAWTNEPHLAGSQSDYNSAIEQLKVFHDHFGIQQSKPLPIYEAGSVKSRHAVRSILELTEPKAWIDKYYPLLETPGERKLEILDASGNAIWGAELEEQPADGDPASRWYNTVGAWHAFSGVGEVKGKLVYANYGDPGDFDKLVAEGYNLTGTIILLRYGNNFRGLQVKAAYEAGAAGCLIYEDPRADAPVTTENGYKSWPEGPARNPHAIQRGHVLDISLYSGDPTTPGYPSYHNASRVKNTNLPSIPSLPVSWANTQVLLQELKNSGKNISDREVRLVNNVNRKFGPIWNTMAVIPGHIRNEVVIAGNHRDAWVLGAADPTSGTVSMHEVSKGLGELLRRGWRPLRTILLASWDGEEYGLFGSTEWGEDFEDWIRENVVAYLNVDKSSSGRALRLRGTPSLAHLLRQAALDIPHYEDNVRTLWDARNDHGLFMDPAKQARSGAIPKGQQKTPAIIRPLGSGSDYTVFLQRFGLACADEAFTRARGDAVYHYHSLWDSGTWMDKYGDPGYLRHVTIAKHLGLVILRLADSFILPINTTHYALELDNYLDKVVELLPTLPGAPDVTNLREAIGEVQTASRKLDQLKSQINDQINQILAQHNSGAACVGGLTCASIETHIGLQQVFDSSLDIPSKNMGLAKLVEHVASINKKLSTFEQGFISDAGIPGREWYRHMIVAPGKRKGYGATTFPTLTEAITIEHNATLATLEMERLVQLLRTLAQKLDKND